MPRPLQIDLLTLRVVSESRVTWATSVPIFVFIGPSVLELGTMYATDRRQTDRRRQTRIIALCIRPMRAGHNKELSRDAVMVHFGQALSR